MSTENGSSHGTRSHRIRNLVSMWFSVLALLVFLVSCSQQSEQHGAGFLSLTIGVKEDVLAAQVVVSYDADKLKFKGTSDLNDRITTVSQDDEGTVWLGLLAGQAVTGPLTELTFQVIAPGGEVHIKSFKASTPTGDSITEPTTSLVQRDDARNIQPPLITGHLSVQSSTPSVSSEGIDLEPDFADYSLGDVQRDHDIDFNDAVEVIYVMFRIDRSDYALYQSDMNGDGVVEFNDAVAILYKMLRIGRLDRGFLGTPLQVFPRELNLSPGETKLVLLGNAMTADRVSLVSPPDAPSG